jgi:hypothetical protein
MNLGAYEPEFMKYIYMTSKTLVCAYKDLDATHFIPIGAFALADKTSQEA